MEMKGFEVSVLEDMDNTAEHYNPQITNSMNMSELEDEYEYDLEEEINFFFWEELLPVLFVYSLTFILGLVGNILIIFTTFRYRKMKSTTNVFLASLALADLLLIIFCIPVKEVFEPFLENAIRKGDISDCLDLPGESSKQIALNKVRGILDELIAGEGICKLVEKESEKEKLCEGDSNLSSVLVKIFSKEPKETSELEQLMLMLKDALKEGSGGTRETDDWELVKSEENSQDIDGKMPSGPVSLIAYPVSTGNSEGFGVMKKLKNYSFDGSVKGKPGEEEEMRGRPIGKEGKKKLTERLRLRKMHDMNEDDIAIIDDMDNERGRGDMYSQSDTFVGLLNESTDGDDLSENASYGTTKTSNSGRSDHKRKVPKPSKRRSGAKERTAKSKRPSAYAPKCEPTCVVEKRITSLECRLKELLRRIGICPTKEQEAIKKCLERLKETSEAVLRRLRRGRSDSSKCCRNVKVDKVSHFTQRGYQSEPESAIKMSTDQKSIILKTSESEIHLNLGMEITMENFDPATGKKLRPEENKDFVQQGNIRCKLVKPGEEPVTFIDTNFLYSPKTGMLFKGNRPPNRRGKSKESPAKPTKAYLFPRVTQPKYPPSSGESSTSRKKSKSVEFRKRDSSEESRLSTELNYTVDQGTSSETSKSLHSDPFRIAVDREEGKYVKYQDRKFEDTSRSVGSRPLSRSKQKRASSLASDSKSGVQFSVQAMPEQTCHVKEVPQGRTEKQSSPRKVGVVQVRARDECIQTNLMGKWNVEPEVVPKKSTGVQAEVKARGKVLSSRGTDTFSHQVPSERHKMVNICVQTLPPQQSGGRRRISEAASQTSFILEETRKYLKDLETQKRLAKLFSFTWSFGFFICKLVYYMQSVSAICSVLTLAAMSVERYYAIVHPMRAQYICTISQARKIITLTWISSLFLAIPVLFAQIHMPVGVRVKAFWCVRDFDNPTIWRAHETYMLLLILIIPTSVMVVAYTTICMEIWHVMERRQDLTGGKLINVRQTKSESSSYNARASGKEKKKFEGKACDACAEDQAHVRQAIKMLVAVVVIFVVCWTPFLIDNLLQSYGIFPFMKFGQQKNMTTTFHLMAYFNSCVNPIIYGFMSKNFRESFRKALCCGKRAGRTSARNTSVSNDKSTSIRYAESSFGRTVSVAIPD